MNTSRIATPLVLGMMLCLLTSCIGIATDTPGTATPRPTARENSSSTNRDLAEISRHYPAVDGSTSTHPLQVLAACKILQVTCEWIPPLFSERTILPISDSASPESLEQVSSIYHSGTHDSYVNLIEGRTDLILVARSPSEDEKQAAERRGVRLDIRAVALDAFVFLVNQENPVNSLTLDQIRGIYGGETIDWQAVGGNPGTIRAYQRDRNSGSQELMDELVMQGRAMIDTPDMILTSMVGPINAISQDVNGLGYSVFYYATFMLPDENIRLLGIGGIVPSSETIADRSYPLVTEVYGVIRADTRHNDPAFLLRDWLLSEAGQAVVAESGYIPLP